MPLEGNNPTLRPVYTERLRLRLPLTPMMDANAFYIKLYRKTQTQPLGVNRPLKVHLHRVIANARTKAMPFL